ncbi:MAG: hypothetical protein H6832_17155 [Planctomycetes bacterium]|nr:hypothetical protein [Planctomycetota bacterium]
MDPALPTSHPDKFELFLFSLPPTAPQGEQMCSGHAWTSSGDLLVAGGNWYDPANYHVYGNKIVYIYQSVLRTWLSRRALAHDRWYPSVTTLGDGRMAITGGIRDSGTLTSSGVSDPKDHTYEIYDPTLNSYQLNSVARYGSTQLFYGPGLNGDMGSKLGEYPRSHVIAEGNPSASPSYGYVFVSHQFKSHGTNTGDRSAKVDIEINPETWTSPATWSTSSAYSGTGFRRNKGASTLWPNLGVSLIAENTVVRLGGTLQSIATPSNEVVTASVEACLASGGGSAWTALPSLNNARQWPDLVLLADGSLFVVGGASNIQQFPPNPNDPTPVMASEILVPGNSVWNVQPNMYSSRLYHSTALLLPSAKVMTGGGEFGWLWA